MRIEAFTLRRGGSLVGYAVWHVQSIAVERIDLLPGTLFSVAQPIIVDPAFAKENHGC